MLRKIIIEQVASMMVLPNKWPIKLSDIVESAALKIPEPEVLESYLYFTRHPERKNIFVVGRSKSTRG